MSALYTFDGRAYLPGPMCVGPWSPDAQHGGPVSALLAGAVESAIDPRFEDVPVQTVRVTVELLRPVPLAPLTLSTAVVRPGRNVQLVEATMHAGDQEVARARGLRIRRASMDVPIERAEPPSPVPSSSDPPDSSVARRTAFAEAVDLRFVKGSWDETGPVVMWTRLLVPVVEGRDASPLQRVTAAADFGNGVSRVLEFDHHTFINPDLTVALARLPEGEWIGFDVVSRLSSEGFGQAESAVFDPLGPVGRSVQSLLVSER